MVKVPTPWKRNPAKDADAVAYSSPSVAYNAPLVPFSSATVAEAESGKLPDLWSRPSKLATMFVPNPAANTSLYVYDSTTRAYDSVNDSYDGVVAGQDFNDQKTPSAWSAA